MRNLFLLIGLAFCVYFGSSLWTFSDAASFRVAANYIPLAVMVLTMVVGLIHLRFALALTVGCVLLCGNAAIFDYLLYLVCHLFGWETFFSSSIPVGPAMKFFQLAPVSYECLVLGLFASWAITRFFGNAELDFEVNRARTARQMHLPVLLFGLSAVLAGLYAIVVSGNIFFPGFFAKIKDLTCVMPFPFFARFKADNLTALRNATLVIELIAFYTIVINEVWSERHIKFFIGFLTLAGLFSVCVGVVQRIALTGFSSYVYRYTREVHGTFSDPNAWSIYLLTLLPVGLGLLYAGFLPALCGLATILLLLLGIALSASKVAAMWAALALVIFFLYSLVKAFRGGKVIPPVFVGLLLACAAIFAVGSYTHVDQKELLSYKNDHPVQGAYKDEESSEKGIFNNRLSIALANQIDSFRLAFTKKGNNLTDKGRVDFETDLYYRTNHKSADWITVFNFLKPSNGNWDALAVGCGPGTFYKKYRQYQPSYVQETRGNASSFFLQALVEQGFFGLAAMVLISLLTIVTAFGCVEHTASPRTSRVLAFMFTFLVCGCLFENSFMQYQIAMLYWLLCGLVMVNAATTNRDFQLNFKFLFLMLILFCIVAAVCSAWPRIMEQRFERKSFDAAAERMAKRMGPMAPEDLKSELYQRKEYGFHYNRVGRWSDRWSHMLVRPDQDCSVLQIEVACGHPEVSDKKPVSATVYIEATEAMHFVFTNSCLKVLDYDLRREKELSDLLGERDYLGVTINCDSVFTPAKYYPSMTNDTYSVGVFVGKVSWLKKEQHGPEEVVETPDETEPEAPEAPAAEETPVQEQVKPEETSEVNVPKETIFGDQVTEDKLDETLEQMSDFELELPN